MSRTLTDRTLALAGLFQAGSLVQQIAHTGQADEAALEASLYSVVKVEADTTEAIFGGIQGVIAGLELLRTRLGRRQDPEDMELLRYAVAVLHLERRLNKRHDLLDHLRQGIEAAHHQTNHFPVNHENVVAKLASLYSETLSTLTPRIMVRGEPTYLNNPDYANKIRALLLAAVRAAVLWRQSGGNRWQLLVGRNKIAAEAERLLKANREDADADDQVE